MGGGFDRLEHPMSELKLWGDYSTCILDRTGSQRRDDERMVPVVMLCDIGPILVQDLHQASPQMRLHVYQVFELPSKRPMSNLGNLVMGRSFV